MKMDVIAATARRLQATGLQRQPAYSGEQFANSDNNDGEDMLADLLSRVSQLDIATKRDASPTSLDSKPANKNASTTCESQTTNGDAPVTYHESKPSNKNAPTASRESRPTNGEAICGNKSCHTPTQQANIEDLEIGLSALSFSSTEVLKIVKSLKDKDTVGFIKDAKLQDIQDGGDLVKKVDSKVDDVKVDDIKVDDVKADDVKVDDVKVDDVKVDDVKVDDVKVDDVKVEDVKVERDVDDEKSKFKVTELTIPVETKDKDKDKVSQDGNLSPRGPTRLDRALGPVRCGPYQCPPKSRSLHHGSGGGFVTVWESVSDRLAVDQCQVDAWGSSNFNIPPLNIPDEEFNYPDSLETLVSMSSPPEDMGIDEEICVENPRRDTNRNDSLSVSVDENQVADWLAEREFADWLAEQEFADQALSNVALEMGASHPTIPSTVVELGNTACNTCNDRAPAAWHDNPPSNSSSGYNSSDSPRSVSTPSPSSAVPTCFSSLDFSSPVAVLPSGQLCCDLADAPSPNKQLYSPVASSANERNCSPVGILSNERPFRHTSMASNERTSLSPVTVAASDYVYSPVGVPSSEHAHSPDSAVLSPNCLMYSPVNVSSSDGNNEQCSKSSLAYTEIDAAFYSDPWKNVEFAGLFVDDDNVLSTMLPEREERLQLPRYDIAEDAVFISSEISAENSVPSLLLPHNVARAQPSFVQSQLNVLPMHNETPFQPNIPPTRSGVGAMSNLQLNVETVATLARFMPDLTQLPGHLTPLLPNVDALLAGAPSVLPRLQPVPATVAASATKRLVEKLDGDKKSKIWAKIATNSDEDLVKVDQDGDTELMILVLQPASQLKGCMLEYVYALVQRLKLIPGALSSVNHQKHSALYLAALHCTDPDSPLIARYLAEAMIETGTPVDMEYAGGDSLLHCLCREGDRSHETVRELLSLRDPAGRLCFSTDKYNHRGMTPLLEAVRCHGLVNSTKNVKLLVTVGTDATLPPLRQSDESPRVTTAVHLAVTTSCDPALVEALLCDARLSAAACATPPYCSGGILHEVARRNDVPLDHQHRVYEALVARGARRDARDGGGRLPVELLTAERREIFKVQSAKR